MIFSNIRLQNFIIISLSLLLIYLVTGCTFNIRNHYNKRAADIAEGFAQTAIIDRDYKEMDKYLVTSDSGNTPVNEIKEIVKNMHPSDNYPIEIKATEYEIVPQSSFTNVYLIGTDKEDNKYFYLFVLSQDKFNNYKVTEIYRHKEDVPYPKTDLLRKPIQ
jgi:hypothetical protein